MFPKHKLATKKPTCNCRVVEGIHDRDCPITPEGKISCVPNIDTQRLDWPTIRGTWRQRMEEYEKFQTINRDNNNLYDSNRYEGIATATRWCIEDMDKAMASNNPPAEEESK